MIGLYGHHRDDVKLFINHLEKAGKDEPLLLKKAKGQEIIKILSQMISDSEQDLHDLALERVSVSDSPGYPNSPICKAIEEVSEDDYKKVIEFLRARSGSKHGC